MNRWLQIVCCGVLILGLADRAEADPDQKPAEVVPAERRWAADGPGGVPEFTRHVQPLLGRMGCNNRGCHGSFQGQGGFRLSLFGSDPKMDFEALKARIDAKEPAASPLLLKPTREVAHRGGRRFEAGSWQYRMLKAWIAAGAPYTPSREVAVDRLEVVPAQAVLAGRGETVQIKVVAHYADKSKEDVTGLTQFTTNDEAVARVTDAGLVTAGGSGDTAVVVTFGGSVSSAHVLVPHTGTTDRAPDFQANNKIDELVAAKWKKLGLQPSELSSDVEFLRRVSLDLIGTLPTPDEVRKFLADKDANKRSKKIDELLERPEYATYWATKFSDLTGNDSAGTPPPAAKTSWLWHGWLREKLAANVPYDELAAGIVTATTREGRTVEQTVAEYRKVVDEIGAGLEAAADNRTVTNADSHFASPSYARRKTLDLFWKTYTGEQAALRVSYAFLGVRLECAQCHKHPYDRWTQDDFRGYTAFFDSVAVGVPGDVPKDVILPQGGDQRKRELVYRYTEVSVGPVGAGNQGGKGVVGAAKPGAAVKPRLPGGPELTPKDGQDPRTLLMDWLRAADNPFFARALVNRLWRHYLGVGLIEPADEISAGNPPTNPELLDWLAQDFVAHQFDLKHLHRTILNSRVYQLSWRPSDNNRLDERNYSHARLRRLPAEVVVDAINQATGGKEPAYLWKAKTYTLKIAPEGTRTIGLAPTRFGGTAGASGYALEVFGRPLRAETCDGERSQDVTLTQVLYLMNDAEVQAKTAAPDGRLAKLFKEIKDDRQRVEELYLGTLSRFPTEKEMKKSLDYVARAADRKAGFEDLLWSLLNVREFVLNH